MLRGQTVLEFLVSYGWMLIILAVVLFLLFDFGFFSFTGARASPGVCQLVRPYGVASSQFISFTGVCTGLEPEFTVDFASINNYFYIHPSPTIYGNTATSTAWIYITQFNPTVRYRSNILVTNGGGAELGGQGTRLSVDNDSNHELDYAVWTFGGGGHFYEATSTANSIQVNKWYFVVGTYNGVDLAVYINGQLSGTTPVNGIINVNHASTSQNSIIGEGAQLDAAIYHGYISNVQFYNTSLTQSQITTLYQKGIGAVPIDPQNLVGWWPLNGNGNDYGGNGYNGGPTNVTYNNGALGNYTAP